MVPGEDVVVVRYALVKGKGGGKMRLELHPMLAGRDFHGTIQLQQRPWWTMLPGGGGGERGMIGVESPECPVKVYFGHNADRCNINASWWYNFKFRMEQQRGYPDREDLWTPGMMTFSLEPGKVVGFVASTRPEAWEKQEELVRRAKERHGRLARTFAKTGVGDDADEFLSTLAVAADQFVVQRGTDKHSVIAGYPWFEDWGRDTFIAMCGLTLVTGRFEIAKSILATFADHMRRGLLPNRFPDKSVTPDYNTVDASLWFIHAAYQYWRYSGDEAFLTRYLYPKLCEVMERYRDGTDFGIRMDSDGLIRAGDGNHQPTWMDAKIGDWVVTPRHGKPVEINALWYSNLRVMSLVAERAGDSARSAGFWMLAEKAALVFEKTYFNGVTNCLNDVVGDDGERGRADESIRPNQLMAVSLPFSPLSAEASASVVAVCQKLLLTPMGMRTLSPTSPGYHGQCVGDQRTRDMAYHQGTAWPWLIGPFVTAYVKVRGKTAEARAEARNFVEPFRTHLKKAKVGGGLGSISEIADGDGPFTPRGCPAQAWSVGEVLRAYWEDILNRAPAWPHEK